LFVPFQMNLKTIMKIFCVIALLACAFSLRAQVTAEYKARADSGKTWPKEAVRGAHGMVATDEELASRAGVEICNAAAMRWTPRWQPRLRWR